jgi:hypothetical protein
MQALSNQVMNQNKLLETIKIPELKTILDADIQLNNSFTSNLSNLTAAWAKIILSEHADEYLHIGDKRYGLSCWRVALDTYLKEEAEDIAKRTVATNLKLYVTLLINIVNEMQSLTAGSKTSVDLFAFTNLLPAQFFNWKEYGDPHSHDHRFGTSNAFINRYRHAVKEWIHPNSGLTLTRFIVVEAFNGASEEERRTLNALSIRPFEDLENQSSYSILYKAGEPYLAEVSKLIEFMKSDCALWKQYPDAKAYGIDRSFHQDKLIAGDLSRKLLIDGFSEELHSRPSTDHALCLTLSSTECVRQLDHLPTIPVEGQDLKSADFLAVRLEWEGGSRVIACIVAQLKPNLETMALHLITREDELKDIETFINFAKSKGTPLSSLKPGQADSRAAS